MPREERVQEVVRQRIRTIYTDRGKQYSLRDSEIHSLSEVGMIPISYAKPLLASDRVKPLAQLAEPAPRNDAKQGLERLVGTDTGLLAEQTERGRALALTVEVENGVLRANAAITGSPSGYKGDSLMASNLKDMGDGVWPVEFTGEHSNLTATGIFKPGSFVGDFAYKYSRHRRPDGGQWIVQKQP